MTRDTHTGTVNGELLVAALEVRHHAGKRQHLEVWEQRQTQHVHTTDTRAGRQRGEGTSPIPPKLLWSLVSDPHLRANRLWLQVVSLCRRNQVTDPSGLVPSRWGAAGCREQAGISGERVLLSARSPSSQKAPKGPLQRRGPLRAARQPPKQRGRRVGRPSLRHHAHRTDSRAPALLAAPWLPSSEPGGDAAVHTAKERPPLHQENTGGRSVPGAWDVQKSSGRCRAWLLQGHRLGATAPCPVPAGQARPDAHARQKAQVNERGGTGRGEKNNPWGWEHTAETDMETGWGEAQTFNALGRRRAKFTWKAADSPQKGRAFLVPGPGSTLGHCWDLGLEDPPHIQSKQPAPQSLPALLPAPFFFTGGTR